MDRLTARLGDSNGGTSARMKTDLLRTSRRAVLSGLLVSTASVTRLGATAPPLQLPPLSEGSRRLYLVRHGETDFNVQGRIQGRTNNPLNDNGLGQAELLAEYLSSQPLEVVASSTLQKAAATADAVASRHPAAKRQRLDSFSEMCFGDFEGQQMSAVEKDYKEIVGAWATGDTSRAMPGKRGESPEMVAARGSTGLRALGLIGDVPTAARHVCVVAHPRFNKILIASLQGDLAKASQVAQANACVNVIDLTSDGRSMIRAINLWPFRDSMAMRRLSRSSVGI